MAASESNVQQALESLINCIQPSAPSELRRLTIASYVCDVIRRCFAPQRQVEAFMFGSVPLRAYLPDGDIDISVFTPLQSPNDPIRESWSAQVLKALEREASRRDTHIPIRNIQIIQAEVKLVKFVVADIVVDVSFNALGGLCTVAFLEWIDRAIGRAHLFKRSIVLVKAWCYYESRLLGAHHGLISSYAIEVMVLYVFNVYSSDLHTPLEVLHRFLNVFSVFDWETYALSILGPIPLSSFPTPRVATEAMPHANLLLPKSMLQEMSTRCSLQPAACLAAMDVLLNQSETNVEERSNESVSSVMNRNITFPQKYLNIMDPLLPANNLGRSVSKASFCRIRQALRYGAAKLEAIMQQDPVEAAQSITSFFANTWRSPMRMAADNQAFQSRLAMGGAIMLHHTRAQMSATHPRTLGQETLHSSVEGPSTENSTLTTTTTTTVSSDAEDENAATAGLWGSVFNGHEIFSSPTELPPLPASSGHQSSSLPATPIESPRNPGSLSLEGVPVGNRGAFHASLPPSPALVEARPHQVAAASIFNGPNPNADFFTADIDTLMHNMDLARTWQPEGYGSTLGSDAFPHRAVPSADSLAAAMAALAPLRTGSPILLPDPGSYASVTAHGLTPNTSRGQSPVVSGSDSPIVGGGSGDEPMPRLSWGRGKSSVDSAFSGVPGAKGPSRLGQMHGGRVDAVESNEKEDVGPSNPLWASHPDTYHHQQQSPTLVQPCASSPRLGNWAAAAAPPKPHTCIPSGEKGDMQPLGLIDEPDTETPKDFKLLTEEFPSLEGGRGPT